MPLPPAHGLRKSMSAGPQFGFRTCREANVIVVTHLVSIWVQ